MSGSRTLRQLLPLAALISVALLSGCGSGGGAATTSTTSPPAGSPSAGSDFGPAESTTAPKPSSRATPQEESSNNSSSPTPNSAEGAAGFETKGGDNSVQRSGSEASPAELASAADSLYGFLDARAAGNWKKACSYLAPAVAESFGQLSRSKHKPSCAETLPALSAGLPPAALRQAAIAEVGAFRVDGERGFLLFRGAHRRAYFMPMVRVGGAWKVAAPGASALQ